MSGLAGESSSIQESSSLNKKTLLFSINRRKQEKSRIFFSTVTRLTQSHHSIEPCIPGAFICGDSINFNNKIILIRDSILHFPDSSWATGIVEAVISPDRFLESFHPIDLHEPTITLSSSKSSTCILDPTPTRLLKEVLPLITNALLNIFNLSLVTGYVPQSFKVIVIKPLKKTTLDTEILIYRPISKLPFLLLQ